MGAAAPSGNKPGGGHAIEALTDMVLWEQAMITVAGVCLVEV